MTTTEPENPCISSKPELLPVELIAKIISFAADAHRSKGDRRCPSISSTLTAGSLVSHTWNTICRSHIFHTICIIDFSNPAAPLSFLHFQAPHLSEYIRKLHFEWDPCCTAADWLPECFGRLKNLCELHLDAWLPDRVALAPLGIASLLAAPRLRKLVLRDCLFATDASDLLSVLPATIEELILEEIDLRDLRDSRVNAPSNNSKCLAYLRSVDLIYALHPMFQSKAFIECPNLERLCVEYEDSEPWVLPPWVPASLSELEVRVGSDGCIPDFGTTIQPSAVTIRLTAESVDSYYEPFTWVKDCINRLPSPRSIQALTINIVNQNYMPEDDLSDGLYPTLSDYEMLSHFLQKLRVCEHGNLKNITLNVTVEMEAGAIVKGLSDVNESRAAEGREVANLEKGFAELLKANVLDVDFTLKRILDHEDDLSETLVHSSIHTRGL